MEDFLLNQQYKIKKILDKSVFGMTYLVEDVKNYAEYVIKYIKLKKPLSKNNLKQFKKEISSLTSIINNNIPRFLDYFINETEEDIEIFTVQEYIDGRNLYQLIEEGYKFTEKEVIEIALEISKLLEYTHSFSPSIFHKEIKPSNIIINKDKKVYLIDFVASREKLLSTNLKAKNISSTISSQGYKPKEQFEGTIYPSTDIYSLGCVLIYLLSQKEPFEFKKKEMKINYKDSISVSISFESILDKMIDPYPFNRYEDVSYLKKDLESLSKNKPVKVFKNLHLFNSFVTIIILSIIIFNLINDIQNNYEKYNIQGTIKIDNKKIDLIYKEKPLLKIIDKKTNKYINNEIIYNNGFFKINNLKSGNYQLIVGFENKKKENYLGNFIVNNNRDDLNINVTLFNSVKNN